MKSKMLLFTTHDGGVIQMKEEDYVSPFSNDSAITSSVAATASTSIATDIQSPPIFSPMTMALTFTPLPTPSPMAPMSTDPSTAYLESKSIDTGTPKPIIILTDTDHLPATPSMAESHNPAPAKVQLQKVRTVSRRSSKTPLLPGESDHILTSWMVYNEYGELVTMEQQSKPVVAEELTVTQALRLVYKNYHREVSHQQKPFERCEVDIFTV